MQPANAFTSEDGPSPGAEHFERAATLALQMLDGKASPSEILACLVNAAEEAAGSGAVASILVLDKEGLLRNGASPKLPVDYLQAIDRLKPNARVGTCAAAAATKSVVITQDFSADDKWAELRHLPMSLGFVGAWSTPIVSADGQVMGTFGTYFRERRQPTPQELMASKNWRPLPPWSSPGSLTTLMLRPADDVLVLGKRSAVQLSTLNILTHASGQSFSGIFCARKNRTGWFVS